MVRPLLEIEQPFLTRDQLEAAIWRLTGTKNRAAIEQLLRLADVYAVSQGPALIDALHERDRSRERWKVEFPGYGANAAVTPGNGSIRQLRLAATNPADVSISDANGDAAASAFDFSKLQEHAGKPERANPVWLLPDGTMWQRCGSCLTPKPYDEFYKDANRWNGKASQCKLCKNGNRKSA